MLVADVKTNGELFRLLSKMTSIKGGMRVGFYPTATYPDGESVAYVAYLNEYGTATIPPRPFMERTAAKHNKKWTRGIENHILRNGIDQAVITEAFEMAGQVAVGDVKRTIADWPVTDPRSNAPSTIRRKRARTESGRGTVGIDPERVLIDTGVMIASVEYEVNK